MSARLAASAMVPQTTSSPDASTGILCLTIVSPLHVSNLTKAHRTYALPERSVKQA